MILELFSSKSADKMICFDLIFYVFFLKFIFKQVFRHILDRIGPYRTILNWIGPYQTESGHVEKKKIVHGHACNRVHGRTTHLRESDSGALAKLAHPCFLGQTMQWSN